MPTQSQRYDRDATRFERRSRERFIGWILKIAVALLIGGLVSLIRYFS